MKRVICILWAVCCVLFAFGEVKYVFYFIGDGMGPNQVLGAEMYRSAVAGEPLGRVQTLMSTFPYSGAASTFSKSNGITDSSAAGTCLATGSKTKNGTLGLTEKGDTLTTIAEQLKAKGWGVGIMTTVAIDHATPAAFYAHVEDRDKYYRIGKQLCESDFDFFGGAGFHHPQGKHDDKKVNLYRLAEENGYTIAHGYEEAQALLSNDRPQSTQSATPQVEKLILVQKEDDKGAQHGSNLPYSIDRKEGDLTLAQIVETAIPFLDERHERFFMMVEGGMVDYACHGDDGRTAIDEVWDMNEALRVAYDFYLAHPDETLIVVTADHETGGMALGNGGHKLDLAVLQYQQCSSWILSDLFSQVFENNKKPSWEEVKELYRSKLGLWDKVIVTAEEEAELKALYKAAIAHKGKDTKTLYKTLNQLSDAGVQLLNKKAHVGWTTHSHSAHAVPIFSIGVGAEKFSGWKDLTEIAPTISEIIDNS
ncbi:MAG: alkaline phosphatase [Paludibacteraceae bacterium]|nr:alkaline phosphatase [Paludibacteraceae bacterium]